MQVWSGQLGMCMDIYPERVEAGSAQNFDFILCVAINSRCSQLAAGSNMGNLRRFVFIKDYYITQLCGLPKLNHKLVYVFNECVQYSYEETIVISGQLEKVKFMGCFTSYQYFNLIITYDLPS